MMSLLKYSMVQFILMRAKGPELSAIEPNTVRKQLYINLESIQFRNISLFILYFIPMIVFYPVWFYFLPKTSVFDCQSTEENMQQTSHELCLSNQQLVVPKQSWEQFQKLFLQHLKNKKRNKKSLSTQQDEILKNLRQEGKDWTEIAQIIQFSNPDMCKRRFNRLKQQAKRWPKQIDEQIRFLHEQKCYSWSTIAFIINQKFQKREKFNSKQVKQRYIFHLKPGISTEEWTTQQDMLLLRLAREKDNCWKKISESFHQRTQLQLKNRYYGTLKFIQKKVLLQMRENQSQIL